MDREARWVQSVEPESWTDWATSTCAFASQTVYTGLPRWLSNKGPACPCWRRGRHVYHPWVRKIHCRRKRQPTPVFLPGKSHGQRSMVGYSPWDCRVEHDVATEHTHTHTLVRLYTSIYSNFFFLPWNIFPSCLHPYHYFPPPTDNNPGLLHCTRILYCLSHCTMCL